MRHCVKCFIHTISFNPCNPEVGTTILPIITEEETEARKNELNQSMSLRQKLTQPDSKAHLSGLDEGKEKVGLRWIGRKSQGLSPKEYNHLKCRKRSRATKNSNKQRRSSKSGRKRKPRRHSYSEC